MSRAFCAWYELKRGKINESERDQMEGLRLWGFEPDVKQMKENITKFEELRELEHKQQTKIV